MGSDRDSGAEFEQMQQDIEKAENRDNGNEEGADESIERPAPSKQNPKTKNISKAKKKKKTKTTSEFPRSGQ